MMCNVVRCDMQCYHHLVVMWNVACVMSNATEVQQVMVQCDDG